MTGDQPNTEAVRSTDRIPAETVTIESIMAQIDDIQAKANRLVYGVCKQRDDARKRLVEANGRLRTFSHVVKRRGMHTNWEGLEKSLATLLEQQRVAINEFNGYMDPRYSNYPLETSDE